MGLASLISGRLVARGIIEPADVGGQHSLPVGSISGPGRMEMSVITSKLVAATSLSVSFHQADGRA